MHHLPLLPPIGIAPNAHPPLGQVAKSVRPYKATTNPLR